MESKNRQKMRVESNNSIYKFRKENKTDTKV